MAERNVEMKIQKNLDLETDIADDEVKEAKEEYEGWRAREFARIRRDREATVREKEERERVRNMTEEESREWERRKKPNQAADQNKFRFIHKYYHKGAFFHNDAAAADIKLH